MEKAHELSKEERTTDVLTDENITFSEMLLSRRTLRALQAAGFEKPSPIQMKAIPYGRCGFDLIVQAKSGTGKTCVFTVVAMEMLVPKLQKLQVIVLAPTREISVQISNVISSIASGLGEIKVESFIGGLPFEEDKKKVVGCQIAVGAPGRVKHLISSGLMDLNTVRLLVLDEADRLMEEGFRSDISYIFSKLPLNKQIIAVSATFPEELERFLAEFMNKPIRVNPSEDPILIGVRQFAYTIESRSDSQTPVRHKLKALKEILTRISFKQCLVFFNYQSWAESVCKQLLDEGWPATFIHGGQKQRERLRAYDSLKRNQCRIFFSTDLTSRGIDAENVNLVVNVDLPHDCATYLHRIGRAGRYGTYGKAVTIIVDGEEVESFKRLLYNVGGSHFHVHQFPKENIWLNIWEANGCQYERLSTFFGEYKFERRNIYGKDSKYKEEQMNAKKEKAVQILNNYRLQPPEIKGWLHTWEYLSKNLAKFNIEDLKNSVSEGGAKPELKPVPEPVLTSIVCLENGGWDSFYRELNLFRGQNSAELKEDAAKSESDVKENSTTSKEVVPKSESEVKDINTKLEENAAKKSQIGDKKISAKLKKVAAKRKIRNKKISAKLKEDAAKNESDVKEISTTSKEVVPKSESEVKDINTKLKEDAAKNESDVKEISTTSKEVAPESESEVKDINTKLKEDAAKSESEVKGNGTTSKEVVPKSESEVKDINTKLKEDAAKNESDVKEISTTSKEVAPESESEVKDVNTKLKEDAAKRSQIEDKETGTVLKKDAAKRSQIEDKEIITKLKKVAAESESEVKEISIKLKKVACKKIQGYSKQNSTTLKGLFAGGEGHDVEISTKLKEVVPEIEGDSNDPPPKEDINDLRGTPGEEVKVDYSNGNLAGSETSQIGERGEDDGSATNLEINPGYNETMRNWFSMWFNQCRLIKDYVQYYNYFRNNQ